LSWTKLLNVEKLIQLSVKWIIKLKFGEKFCWVQAELQDAQDAAKGLRQEVTRKQGSLQGAQAQLAELRDSEHGPLALKAEKEARGAVEVKLAATKSALSAKARLVSELRDKVRCSPFLVR